jgi:FtsZ-interacting cell division protein YlmF
LFVSFTNVILEEEEDDGNESSSEEEEINEEEEEQEPTPRKKPIRKTEPTKKNTGTSFFDKEKQVIKISLSEIPTVTSLDLNPSRSITRGQEKSSSKSIYSHFSFFHFSHCF